MVDFGSSKDGWVCPNDRQLALRAKLKTGWSVKTQQLRSYSRQESLSDQEQEAILQVIKRAEMLEVTEQERVGRLVERLDNMKKNSMGNGTNQCILCGDHFGMLSSSQLICNDCKKAVCQKCGIETVSTHKEQIWLCKICAETREMWKKSGAWFFKSLPKYIIPEKKNHEISKYVGRKSRAGLDKNSWSRGNTVTKGSSEQEDESSSEDEFSRRSRLARSKKMSEDAGGGEISNSSLKQTVCPPVTTSSEVVVERPMMSLLAQRSESTSLTSDSLYCETDQPSDSDKSMASGSTRGHSRDYRRETSAESGESSSGHVTFSRQTTLDSGNRSMTSEFSHWEMDAENNPYAGAAATNYNYGSSSRRDSMSSGISREWWGSEDRASSVGGAAVMTLSQRTSSTDIIEELEPTEDTYMGTLEFSLLYDPASSALHCSLHRAKGLRGMDINGLADPFCRLYLLPGSVKTNKLESNKLRSKTVHKTRNPEFNETLTYYGVTEADLIKKTLQIILLDDDKYGHDFIGEARIPLIKLRPQQTKHFNVYLEKHFPTDQDQSLWSDEWVRGQILVTLCYSTRRRALVVGIVRCAQLPAMDNNGFSDPFVKLHLKPDPYHRKYKTSIKWKNLNPEFNEEFVFDTKITDLTRQILEITVWDKDYGKSNDYLGGLELGWNSKGERLKQWIDMIKYPDHKHEGWHYLGEEVLSD